MNIVIHVFGSQMHSFLLDAYCRVEELGHRIFACSVLVDTTKQLSEVVIPVTLPPEMHEGSGCFTSLPILAVVSLFNCNHSSGYLMVLICISLMTMCLAAFMISSFVKCLFKPFAHFYWIVFFLLACRSSLYILGASPLSHISVTNIFSPSMAFPFTLLVAFFNE